MSALAATDYYASHQVVRYDPQAAQQARERAAQQVQRPLRTIDNSSRSPSEQTLEGELLNKERNEQQSSASFSDEEYLQRHREEYARAARGYVSQAQQAIDAYQTTAQLNHPADAERVSLLDVYA